jgi:hypothetical protein
MVKITLFEDKKDNCFNYYFPYLTIAHLKLKQL